MLLLASYDIVFQEVPGEVTLALNLSCCPNGCHGCHSAHLQQAVGEPLDEELLGRLLDRYGPAVSCVAFMGGDVDPGALNDLISFMRGTAKYNDLKIAWYSGHSEIAPQIEVKNLNFLKLGPYIEKLGGLASPDTNQRFYAIEPDGSLIDRTGLFRDNAPSPLAR